MKRRRATRVEVERAQRDAVWAIASSASAPVGWAHWFACQFPNVSAVEWADAPVDLRQRFAKAEIATRASDATTAPGGQCKSIEPFTQRPTGLPFAHSREIETGGRVQ